jgi:hypothetical protein
MRNLGQTISDGLAVVLGLTALAVLAIVALPFIPFVLLYTHFSDKNFQREYTEYLRRMNGACFFCYNSRKSSVAFARDVVVPALEPTVQVVFVDGSKVDCGPNSKFISKMLYSVKERKGFPYLLKIRDGQVLDLSVNNQFYSILLGSKPIEPLLARVNAFYASDLSPLA